MADAPVVHIGENSPEYVATQMAQTILFQIEDKSFAGVSREDYLRLVYDCLMVLKGYEPRT